MRLAVVLGLAGLMLAARAQTPDPKAVAAALPQLESAWKADPQNYTSGYNLALAYFETGALAKSRAVIETMLAQRDQAELHNLLGDIEEAEGHVNEAAHEYERAARLDPSEKNVFDLGTDLLKHRGFEPALKTFEFGTGRYPASARLRVGLGIAYYSLGRYDDAVEALCRAVDLDPNDPKPLEFLGKMNDISQRYAQEVSKRLAHFAAIYPDNGPANYYYALSLRKRSSGGMTDNNRREAESYFRKALAIMPRSAQAHFELALLYEEEGRDEGAIAQYKSAIESDPQLLKAHYRLARLYQKSGKQQLAERELAVVKRLKTSQAASPE